VRQIGPSRAALFTTLTPLVATLIAVAVLGERPGFLHLAGGALIISGVLVSRRPAPVPAAPETLAG
jgi:drug/metabolite transporter (DMT)-like permease